MEFVVRTIRDFAMVRKNINFLSGPTFINLPTVNGDPNFNLFAIPSRSQIKRNNFMDCRSKRQRETSAIKISLIFFFPPFLRKKVIKS